MVQNCSSVTHWDNRKFPQNILNGNDIKNRHFLRTKFNQPILAILPLQYSTHIICIIAISAVIYIIAVIDLKIILIVMRM